MRVTRVHGARFIDVTLLVTWIFPSEAHRSRPEWALWLLGFDRQRPRRSSGDARALPSLEEVGQVFATCWMFG